MQVMVSHELVGVVSYKNLLDHTLVDLYYTACKSHIYAHQEVPWFNGLLMCIYTMIRSTQDSICDPL